MFSRRLVKSSFFTKEDGGVVKEGVKRFVFKKVGGGQGIEKVVVGS